jgi:hypothetical protein
VNVRRTNLVLWTIAGALAVGAVVAIALGLLLPVDAAPDAVATRRVPATTQSSPDAQLPLAAFEPVWVLSLRRPLTHAPATAAAPPPPPETAKTNPAGVPFTLVGTIGDTLALIQTPAGAVEVHAVGENAYGATFVAVRPSQVDVEFAGARHTLTKPKEPG